jgi:hypothetical protein
MENSTSIKQLTFESDALEICWLDAETICFSRELKIEAPEDREWLGVTNFYDLFVINRTDGKVKQFTANHFTREPAPSPMPARALFWRDNRELGTTSEIWETIHPLRRERPLGIQGISPDSSPDQRWTAAALGTNQPEGVGLYRFPTNDAYKKLHGPYFNPRFSPDSKMLTYINLESGKSEIWGFDIPDGEPRRLLGVGEKIQRIVDFGWVKDGSGYILVLEDENSKRDVYYWEIKEKDLRKLTEFGDVDAATAWH